VDRRGDGVVRSRSSEGEEVERGEGSGRRERGERRGMWRDRLRVVER
jgi:hypothetical protein